MDTKQRQLEQVQGYKELNAQIKIDEEVILPNGKRMEIIRAKAGIPKQNALIMVLPGGGYAYLSYRETRQVALAYAKEGFDTAIVYYSVKEWEDVRKDGIGLGISPMIDTAHAIDFIRHCPDFKDEKLVLLGFSAGGHLAAMMATAFDREDLKKAYPWRGSLRVDATILAYAVTSRYPDGFHNQALEALTATRNIDDYEPFSPLEHVTKDTPPAFVWHSADDNVVPVEHSTKYASELHKHGVKAELLIFPTGGHGTSLATSAVEPSGVFAQANAHVASWFEKSVAFVKDFIL